MLPPTRVIPIFLMYKKLEYLQMLVYYIMFTMYTMLIIQCISDGVTLSLQINWRSLWIKKEDNIGQHDHIHDHVRTPSLSILSHLWHSFGSTKRRASANGQRWPQPQALIIPSLPPACWCLPVDLMPAWLTHPVRFPSSGLHWPSAWPSLLIWLTSSLSPP